MSLKKSEFARGVLVAASFANEYPTTHPYRLDDCIAMKLNVIDRRRPRQNKRKLQNPKEAFTHGMALALAEVHRMGRHTSTVLEAASAAGLTMAELKKIGVDPYDLRELKKAGLK